eukprot:757846-Hanusia_phi.AAC.4
MEETCISGGKIPDIPRTTRGSLSKAFCRPHAAGATPSAVVLTGQPCIVLGFNRWSHWTRRNLSLPTSPSDSRAAGGDIKRGRAEPQSRSPSSSCPSSSCPAQRRQRGRPESRPGVLSELTRARVQRSQIHAQGAGSGRDGRRERTRKWDIRQPTEQAGRRCRSFSLDLCDLPVHYISAHQQCNNHRHSQQPPSALFYQSSPKDKAPAIRASYSKRSSLVLHRYRRPASPFLSNLVGFQQSTSLTFTHTSSPTSTMSLGSILSPLPFDSVI